MHHKCVLIWGSGSQALLYAESLKELGATYYVFDPYGVSSPRWVPESRFENTKSALGKLISKCDKYIVAIGGEHGMARFDLHCALRRTGLSPLSIIDPTSNVKKSARFDEMSVIAQSVTVNHHCRFGEAIILNTGATIDHECVIGNGVHVMGSAAVAGRVKIGDWAVIGTNATILPDIEIGQGAYVGAGATVTSDIPPNSVVVGTPAVFLKKRAPRSDPRIDNIFDNEIQVPDDH